MTTSMVAAFVVRCGLVMLFLPFSALDKVLNFGGAVKQASEVVKARPLAVVLILCGLSTEIVMSVGIITGIADRLAAFMLAGYCVVTALLWKQFWKPGDFWTGGKGRDLFWDFLKNCSLGAGILLITVGLDGHGLTLFLADPLASSHPYATAAPP